MRKENGDIMGMIDVSGKKIVPRTAIAEGVLELGKVTLAAIRAGNIRKGDPLKTAEIAALLAVKDTCMKIPHCHPIPLTFVSAEFHVGEGSVKCTCTASADYRTGVEMEALSGVCAALLTVWDMVKYLEKDADGQYPSTAIKDVKVVKKEKGV